MKFSTRHALSVLVGGLMIVRAEEAPPPELSVTTVEGNRPNDRDSLTVPASVVHMNFDDQQNGPVTDAGDVARYDPGISIPLDIVGADPFVPYGNSGFTSYRIRGIGGNRLLLTVDGIRQPPEFEQAGGMGRTFFDPRIYGGVNILKGTGSARYGSEAMGGAVDFRSRSLAEELEYSPQPWLFKSSTRYKTANSSINELIQSGVRVSNLYITVSDSYTAGHETENDKGDVEANPLDFDQNHLLGTITYLPNHEHRLSLTAEHFIYTGDSRLHSVEDAIADVYYADSANTNERTRISLNYVNTPATGFLERFDVNLYVQRAESRSLNRRNSRIDYPSPIPDLEQDRTDRIEFLHELAGGTATAVHRFDAAGFDHTLAYGIELGMEHAENTFDRTVIQNSIEIPSSTPNYFDPADLYRAEVFTEDTLRKGRWSLTGGLRGGIYRIVPDNSTTYLAGTGNSPREDYANSSILPSLSVDYELSTSARLWARYARNVRNPSMEDYVGYFDHGTDFYQIPNLDLEAETADGVEAGIKYSSESFDAELSGFYTLYDGFIDQVATGNTSGGKDEITLDNVGEVEIYGTDLSLTYRPSARWELLDGFSAGTRIGYAYGWNRTQQDFQDSVDPFQTVLMIGYDDPAGIWGVRLIGTYRARKTDISNDWNSFVPPSSFVLDGTAYWNITEKVSVELAVRNLTDEKYWIWPNSGRLDHDFNENPELAVQPGINGLLTLNIQF